MPLQQIYCVSVYSLLNFDNIELVVKATFSLKCYVSFALALFLYGMKPKMQNVNSENC